MYFFRLILGVFLVLMLMYYIMLALHLWNIVKITDEEITPKAIIPFYYWFK